MDTYKNYALSTLDASISETNSLAASDAYFARIAADNYGTITVDDDAYAMRQQFDNDNFQAQNTERKEINAAKTETNKTIKKETRNAVNNDFTGYFESLIGIQTTYENAVAAADETYYGTVTTADALFDTTVKTADKTYADDYCRLTGQYYDAIIIIDGGGDIEDGAFENTNYVSLNFGQNNATQNNNNNTSNGWKQKLKEFGCSTLQFGIYFAEELGPSYSPNLNLIERLWKFFNEKVRNNRYYGTFSQFTKACKSFFRQRKKWTQELRSRLSQNFHQFNTNISSN